MTDSEILTVVSELEKWLGRNTGNALNTALSIEEPGGSSPAWVDLLAHFKVMPVSQEERIKTAKITGMQRGASPEELTELLTAITRSMKSKIKKLPWPDDNALSLRIDRLRALTDRILEENMAAYRKIVFPKKGMFAHAKEAADKSRNEPGWKVSSEAFVNCCRGCGAPRINPSHLECEYCGEHF